jgi:hypothetical protein
MIFFWKVLFTDFIVTVAILTYLICCEFWYKAVLLEAMDGAWEERRFRFYFLIISALEGGEWSASRPGRALPPTHITREAGWQQKLVWTQRLEEKSSASAAVLQPVVRHYTDWATELVDSDILNVSLYVVKCW